MASKIRIKEQKIDKKLEEAKKDAQDIKMSLTDFELDYKSKFIKDLEEKRKGKLISFGNIEEYSSVLASWLNSIVKGDEKFVDKNMIIVERVNQNKEKVINILFYTSENSYSITALKPNDNNKGYLGCVTTNRKPDVGEWWNRGHDLADGKFNENTWNKIICDIVATEMQTLEFDFNIHQ